MNLSRDRLHLSEVEEQVHLDLLHVDEGANAIAATRGGCPSRTQVEHRSGPHFCDETAHFSLFRGYKFQVLDAGGSRSVPPHSPDSGMSGQGAGGIVAPAQV